MRKIVILCLFLLSLASWAGATDYYIKNAGNDEAAGTSDGAAWKTIAKVNDFAEATGFADGDTINFNRGDTWSSDETLGYDGSEIDWGTINGLTVQAYGTGAKPRLNGNTQRPIFISDSDTSATGITNLAIKDIDVSGGDWWTSGWFDANVRIEYCSGIVIDGVDFNGHAGASDNGPTGALYIAVPHGNVEIKNCTIQNCIGIGGTLGEWGAIDCHGILLIWTVAASPAGPKTSGTISIHDNTIHDVEADCIQLMGMTTATNVYDNKMYNFGENAMDFKGAHDTEIYHNEFYRGDYGLGGSGGGLGNLCFHNEGLYTCTDIIIRDNYIHTSDYIGIRMLHGTDVDIYRNYFKDVTCGIQCNNNTRVNVYNNVFNLAVAAAPYGSSLDAGIYFDAGYKNACTIFNNTFYLGADHRFGLALYHASVTARNNVIYCTRNNADCWPLRVAADVSPTVGYNVYYNPNHTNRVRWYSTTYSSSQEATYKSAHDAGAIFSTPGIDFANGKFYPDHVTDAVVDSGTSTGASDAATGLRFDSTWTPSFSIVTVPDDATYDRGAYKFRAFRDSLINTM